MLNSVRGYDILGDVADTVERNTVRRFKREKLKIVQVSTSNISYSYVGFLVIIIRNPDQEVIRV